ncbi:WD40 repeat-like protein [Neolentinus lepideus HHB14362 ss-1]|uniref:WD40 repeat-like protein n=1 Tax=Neolentinus lepideus HHB14362 ss-1 TaxID=1314782 RepID=A0A165W3V0_9AGAM|nr:WD40 repeat-like protein [Neolentinus lepideus HHB14362 ss-1]
MDSETETTPWYRQTDSPIPFFLCQKIASNDPARTAFTAIATFPWEIDSISTLCDGSLNTPELRPQWMQIVQDWYGAMIVGAKGKIYVMPRQGNTSQKPLCVKLPQGDDALSSIDIKCVAWAMGSLVAPVVMVVFAAGSLLYVVDVRSRQIIGYLRGHGGAITSIAVHPVHPYIFCTTSRDFTTRIYDLTQAPAQYPTNPHWPPSKEPSLAGAAYGLQMSEPEGQGIGRCVAVLAGGRSGGHMAAVLSASFHPVLPLIATCGMDRVAKIWPIPSLEGGHIAREDKPFFSTSLLHQARILSITWLSQDVLLTHSAPALMRVDKDDRDSETYETEGTLAVWRWLGVDRFFPPEFEDSMSQRVKRGCASDYQESASFKIISVLKLPMTTRHLHVYQSPVHDPIVLMSQANIIRILNVCNLEPCPPPPSPFRDELAEIAKRLQLSNSLSHQSLNRASTTMSTADETVAEPNSLWPDCWKLIAPQGGTYGDADPPTIEACEVSQDGRIITAVGSRGHIWIWRISSED